MVTSIADAGYWHKPIVTVKQIEYFRNGAGNDKFSSS